MTLIAVLDYGIGNLRSAQKALQRVGADARLTADPGLVREAAGVVLPGVGNFGRCMQALEDTGLDQLAIECACSGRPFLGVCVGMQMLYEGSEETPAVPGLGVLHGVVRLLPKGVKRPQMQWNVLDRRRESGLLAGVPEPTWVYFVHSYAADSDEHAVATCDYGGLVVAAVEAGALWATQFHPEKSGVTGMRILANFVSRAVESAAAA
jgi:glutamine amidotransferase